MNDRTANGSGNAPQGSVGVASAGLAERLARPPMRCQRSALHRPYATDGHLQGAGRDAPAASPRLSQPILGLESWVLQSCVSHELPADFVTDLRTDRDALTACNSGKHSDNQEGVAATTAIDDLLAQAQSVITRLDAAVKNKYARDPEKLAAWKSASHTVKPEKRLQPPVKPTPPAP